MCDMKKVMVVHPLNSMQVPILHGISYLTQARVERAKQLLRSKDRWKLQQIAKMCGFSGERHLRNAFRRITGWMPSAYRQHNEIAFLD
jgi:transcriptional regulator GlxA family with amidase domain